MKTQYSALLLALTVAPHSLIAQGTFLSDPNDSTRPSVVVAPGGNIGIGTSAPLDLLHLWQRDFRSGPNLRLASGLSDGSDYMGGVLFSVTPGETVVGAIQMKEGPSPDRYRLELRNFDGLGLATRMTIQGDGNVGIGTVTPLAPLHLAGGPGGNIRLSPAGPRTPWSTLDLSSPAGTGEQRFTWIAAGDDGTGLPGNNSLYLFQYPPDGNPSCCIGQLRVWLDNGLPRADFSGEVRAAGKVTCQSLEITSDRNAKQDLQAISPREVLSKVASLPIRTWAYTNSPSVRHIGPMAQDFRAAFALGEDEKVIGAGDGIGVALGAVQGLRQELGEQLHEKDVRIAALERQLVDLRSEIATRLAAFELRSAEAMHSGNAGAAVPGPVWATIGQPR